MGEIKWTDPACPISKHFTVKDAIYLPKWNRLANEENDRLGESEKRGLLELFQIMDEVRELLGVPIHTHVAFRPEPYNHLVGGAKYSAHLAQPIRLIQTDYYVAAVDWSSDIDKDGHDSKEDCEKVRQILLPRLEGLRLRMEDNGPEGNWIHLDTKPIPPGGRRFFRA